MSKRCCIDCDYIHLSCATRDWSEVTPGEPFELRCSVGVWELNTYKDGLEEYRKKIYTAETCASFELAVSLLPDPGK